MNEETKERILLNCESYEFHNEQLHKTEKEYFNRLDNLLEDLGSISRLMEPESVYKPSDIIINKLKQVRNSGHEYIATSTKFEMEMQELLKHAPDMADLEIEYDTHKTTFLFLSDFMDELEQSLMLQGKMREAITKQLELFKGYE